MHIPYTTRADCARLQAEIPERAQAMTELVLESPVVATPQRVAVTSVDTFTERVGQAEKFLRVLFSGYELGFVEWRAFSKSGGGNVARRRDYKALPLRDPSAFATEMVRLSDAGWDIYVGVLPRREKRGTADSVRESRWFWADFDAKNLTTGEIDNACEGADIVVRSGHGVHAYWQITKPVDLSQQERREVFSAMLRKVQAGMSGGKADDVSDIPRILRVPGTWNWKNGEKVAVVLSVCPDPPAAPVLESPDAEVIGDEEVLRIKRGMKEMEQAAKEDALPHLFPAWHSCRGHVVNDPNVWVRGQITWLTFALRHQASVRAIDNFDEAVRRGAIVDNIVEELSEDFTNLFLELERRGYPVIGYRDNPIFERRDDALTL